jgi:hypothetical protein
LRIMRMASAFRLSLQVRKPDAQPEACFSAPYRRNESRCELSANRVNQWNTVYSYRNDSMGSRFAAFHAG